MLHTLSRTLIPGGPDSRAARWEPTPEQLHDTGFIGKQRIDGIPARLPLTLAATLADHIHRERLHNRRRGRGGKRKKLHRHLNIGGTMGAGLFEEAA